MAKVKKDEPSRFVKAVDGFEKGQTKGALEAIVEDLFYDFYNQRRKVYRMNFVRGIFFGVGSAIGGTVVLALIVWLLSLFVQFPVIGDYFKSIQQDVKQTTKTH